MTETNVYKLTRGIWPKLEPHSRHAQIYQSRIARLWQNRNRV